MERKKRKETQICICYIQHFLFFFIFPQIQKYKPSAFMYSSKFSLLIIFHVPTNFSTIFPDDVVSFHATLYQSLIRWSLISWLRAFLTTSPARAWPHQPIKFNHYTSLSGVPQTPTQNSGKGSHFFYHKYSVKWHLLGQRILLAKII